MISELHSEYSRDTGLFSYCVNAPPSVLLAVPRDLETKQNGDCFRAYNEDYLSPLVNSSIPPPHIFVSQCFGYCYCLIKQKLENKYKKSRIRDTKNLPTDADSRTDIIFERLRDLFQKKIKKK